MYVMFAKMFKLIARFQWLANNLTRKQELHHLQPQDGDST